MSSEATPQASWLALHRAACLPYRAAGRFAWHFARGKLGRDPVFRSLLEHGLLGERCIRVLDIGCGQGLLASLCLAATELAAKGRWPVEWMAAPELQRYTGIELMAANLVRAKAALGRQGGRFCFVEGDMRSTTLPACDRVVILDVLHYVDPAAQQALLRRVHAALTPGGRLLLRVGDASQRGGFAVSQWVDRLVARARGHRAPPSWGRRLPEWTALLEQQGFVVRSMPMSRGTPFANVLLVADKPKVGA